MSKGAPGRQAAGAAPGNAQLCSLQVLLLKALPLKAKTTVGNDCAGGEEELPGFGRDSQFVAQMDTGEPPLPCALTLRTPREETEGSQPTLGHSLVCSEAAPQGLRQCLALPSLLPTLSKGKVAADAASASPRLQPAAAWLVSGFYLF